MAYSPPFPNVWAWIQNLPPITQWRNDTISMCICSSPSYQPSLKLSITKTLHSSMHLTILIDYHIPIVLWTSKPTQLTSSKPTTQSISHLLNNFVQDVLNYGPTRSPSRVALRLPRLDDSDTIADIFNVSFLTLAFIICIYECPQELRATCIHTLKDHFSCPRSRAASTLLMRLMGSNMEEQWMRCVNLAITNWIVELQAAASNAFGHTITTPSPLFSYSNSSFGLWKV
nr:Acetyl-coenzyme A synthetase [Ipomoea batatas]